MRKFFRAETSIGLLLIFTGMMVMLGWIMRLPFLVQFHAGQSGIVFNTALSFVATGAAFILESFSSKHYSRAVTAIGTGLIVSATVQFLQSVVDSNLTIDGTILHVWLDDSNPRPGRMAPNSALGFIATGFTLILMQNVRSKLTGMAVQWLTFVVILLGLVGLVTYSLQLHLLYAWCNAPRMALPAGVCMVLTGCGLALTWRRAEWYQSARLINEGEKIGFICTAVVVAVATTVGIAGFGAQASALETSLVGNLQFILKSQATIFNAAIDVGMTNAKTLAAQPAVIQSARQAIVTPDAAPSIGQKAEFARSDLPAGLNGFILLDPNNRPHKHVGSVALRNAIETNPDLRLPIASASNDRIYLYNRVPIQDQGAVIGSMIVEQVLPTPIGKLLANDAFGKTGEIEICALQTVQLACLPQSRHPTASTKTRRLENGKPTPMGLAVEGKTGIVRANDNRANSVISAYAPLTLQGLGIVVRQDTEEVYQPIRNQLHLTLPLLLLLLVLAVLLLRAQLKPLVARLVKSERDAGENEARLRRIVDNVGEAIITLDDRGVIETFNHAATDIFGYQCDEIVGQNIRVLIPMHLQHPHDQGMDSILSGDEMRVSGIHHAELTGLQKSGIPFDLEVSINEILVGERRQFVAIARDISEKKRINLASMRSHADLEASVQERTAELQAANEMLHLEVQHRNRVEDALQRTQLILTRAQKIGHMGSWQMNLQTGAAVWSDEFWRVCGLDPTTIQPSIELAIRTLHPEDQIEARNVIQSVLANGTEYKHYRRVIRPDGEVRHVMSQGEVVYDANHEAAMLIGIFLDVTDYKSAVSALEASEKQLREMAAHQDRIEQDERKRVAREIHDELGAVLTGIKSYLSYLVDQTERQNGTPDRYLLDAAELANSAIDTVRRIITDLRPSVLDHLGLWAALEWYGADIQRRSGLRCEFVIDGTTASATVDPDRSTAIFRIVQESITNIVRHAHASQITIRAATLGTALMIEIQDDGIGIALSTERMPGSWGIVGMVERARYFGGDIKIRGIDGQGTWVVLHMPMEAMNG